MYHQVEWIDQLLNALLSQSELINQLIPLPLSLLQHRFPHILDHPALLAHTVYQTVLFDDAIRGADFDIARTWSAVKQRRRGTAGEREWKGLAEQVLSTSDWYERWLSGERKCEPWSCVARYESLLMICLAFSCG